MGNRTKQHKANFFLAADLFNLVEQLLHLTRKLFQPSLSVE